ncbi:hypothetical protein TNCV_4604671 [Trichonephila clavipes]|nr:hypothetical protein TNCV_4604671 [Trichonephila clavipes]
MIDYGLEMIYDRLWSRDDLGTPVAEHKTQHFECNKFNDPVHGCLKTRVWASGLTENITAPLLNQVLRPKLDLTKDLGPRAMWGFVPEYSQKKGISSYVTTGKTALCGDRRLHVGLPPYTVITHLVVSYPRKI